MDGSLTLETKYEAKAGRIFVTGVQALVRLALMQRRRDEAAGLNTAGYISGYRGSPLGGYDAALWRASAHLKSHHIKFQPGVNEDMAATACWGTQQVGLWEGAKYDGVFAIWYGKGPGVDRAGDPLKHGNLAGSSPNGGVLVLAGDDHGAKSSTTAHQSEQALVAAMIPILYPATVQELIDYGLHGIACSRFSGAWVALKCATDVVESSGTVSVDNARVRPIRPSEHKLPEGGVHIRWPDGPRTQEERLIKVKLEAAKAYVRANQLDCITHDTIEKQLGIVTAGKAWLDVCQAFDELGLGEAERRELGIGVYKVAMPWPLEPEGVREFARGFEEILVIEEKRNLIEDQVARALYDLPTAERPRLMGKPIVPAWGELSGAIVARIIAQHFFTEEECLTSARARLAARGERSNLPSAPPERQPWFCAGCPHNTSTKVPEGSRALSGIGCHTMATWMDRQTGPYTHMGGEGGTWIGQAPFTTTKHVFQNIGDGTYFHSGLLAIRAAIAAKVNVTYKILYNDAVALTGGQPLDGNLMPWHITQQLWSEGAGRIAVVSDEPEKYPDGIQWAPGVEIHHRAKLDALQREFREEQGVSVILYDQTCAAEKRRRRKRGEYPDPDRRVFINDAVCEGCGDCNKASNCVAVLPLETPLGRKRTIDQSSCNKDFSCLDGFCPSFVTVEGVTPRRAEGTGAKVGDPADGVPLPTLLAVRGNYNLLLTGIGGTGVVTAGALLGTAAHLDGLSCTVLDQTGLSQKNGAVMSHVRLSDDPEAAHATHIGTGMADAVLGFDMIVAAGAEAVATMDAERTRAVINDHLVPLAAFAENPDMPIRGFGYVDVIQARIGSARTDFIDATRIATRLMGDSIAANVFLIGYAWQKGLVPVSLASLEQAIRLNGAAVDLNLRAFAWGRRAAHDPAAAKADTPAPASENLGDYITARANDLVLYQNEAYAQRYLKRITRLRAAEGEREELGRVVARELYRVMAYKDEYEVARLYCDPAFAEKLAAQFDGAGRLTYHFAPPALGETKRSFGPWIKPALWVLSKLKVVRGTPFDPFGPSADRRLERRLRKDYEALVDEITEKLTPASYEAAVALASTAETVRGFGHIKQASVEKAARDRVKWLARFNEAAATTPLRKTA